MLVGMPTEYFVLERVLAQCFDVFAASAADIGDVLLGQTFKQKISGHWLTAPDQLRCGQFFEGMRTAANLGVCELCVKEHWTLARQQSRKKALSVTA